MSPETGDATRPDDLAERIAGAVLAVPGVTGLHAGVMGEVATYLPGRRVAGVRLVGTGCEVHLVLDPDVPLMSTADEVRREVESLVTGPVTVAVEDIARPTSD